MSWLWRSVTGRLEAGRGKFANTRVIPVRCVCLSGVRVKGKGKEGLALEVCIMFILRAQRNQTQTKGPGVHIDKETSRQASMRH